MGSLPAFRKLNTDDDVLNRLQDNVGQTLGPVLACPLLAGQQLNNISLNAGVNSVNHLLGRTPLGCIVTSLSASVTLNADVSTATATVISIGVTAPTTASFWVY
jgi:hypothetical protein